MISINGQWYNGSSAYYLEITWSSINFDVKGFMPDCKENYVEVFLTSSYRSIGKFCSSNADEPFDMYSSDGQARIIYRTGGNATGSGFTFYYQLKSRSSDHLGSSSLSSTCLNTINYASSGVIYSNGWPYGYQWSYSPCDHEIERSSWYGGVYVVFMDINLDVSGVYDDFVQLFGSNSSWYYSETISSKLSNTSYIKRFTRYDSYLKISFDRSNRGYHSARGFIAGYIKFSSPRLIDHGSKVPRKSPTVDIPLSIVIPVLVIIAIVVAVSVWKKKKQQHSAAPDQTQGPGTALTHYQATGQPTGHSNPQCAYPVTSMIQIGHYTTRQYAMPFPSAASYPAVQYTVAGNVTQPISYVAVPPNGTVPAAPLVLSNEPSLQFSGLPVYSSATTQASHIGNQPSSVPPVDTS